MKTIILIPGLSNTEQQFYELLHDISLDSIWNDGIQLFLNRPSLMGFRQLVRELKSQAKDEPSIMKDILGDECYKVLDRL